MNILPIVGQALSVAVHVIPAVAAGEMTISGFSRAVKGQIQFPKLSSELAAAALYGLAVVTPIPYIAAIATAIFIGYSLLTGGREDAYLSSKMIYKPCEFIIKKIVVPIGEQIVALFDKVIVPVARKIGLLIKKVWELCRNVIVPIVQKIGEILKPVLEKINLIARNIGQLIKSVIVPIAKKIREIIVPVLNKIYDCVLSPFGRFAVKVIDAVWKIGESLVQNVLKPIANAVISIVRPILRFIGSALARLAFIPETFFNNPRWTAFAILATVSIIMIL